MCKGHGFGGPFLIETRDEGAAGGADALAHRLGSRDAHRDSSVRRLRLPPATARLDQRDALRVRQGMLAGFASGTTLLEAGVDTDSASAARAIDAVTWPPGTVITVQHDDVVHAVHAVHAATILRPGDTLSVLCDTSRLDEVRELITAGHDGSEPTVDETDPPMV
ncbi:MAG TPA: hypothetical protein VFF40_02815 [Acidimicrobiia bacterium]|nr:hypothetical protein [Acidimicrobiia bacterium]